MSPSRVRGVSGLLRELAYVIISLVCSLLVALQSCPMLSSKLLRARDKREAAVGGWWTFRRFSSTGWITTWTLRAALGGLWTVVIAFSLLGASLLLLPFIGTEFLPPSDEGEVSVTGEMEIGTRIGLVDEQTRKMEKIVFSAVPEAVSSVVSAGGVGRSAQDSSRGEIRLSLTPAGERDRSNVEIADDLRQRLAGAVPGMEIERVLRRGNFF